MVVVPRIGIKDILVVKIFWSLDQLASFCTSIRLRSVRALLFYSIHELSTRVGEVLNPSSLCLSCMCWFCSDVRADRSQLPSIDSFSLTVLRVL